MDQNFNPSQPSKKESLLSTRLLLGFLTLILIASVFLYWQSAKKREVQRQNIGETGSIIIPYPQKPSPYDLVPPLLSGEPAVEYDTNADCPINTIEEYGEINNRKDVIVYQTECVLKVYANNSRDSLVRFYVRDAEGNFNRKIYQVFNQAGFGGLTYAQVFGLGRIKINRVSNSDDSKFIDILGHEAPSTEAERGPGAMRSFLSPNGEWLAVNDVKGEVPQNVKVINLKTGEAKEYKFSEVGLNGAYVSDWSGDSKILFVVGGIWEFSAPARLWAINVGEQTVKEYEGLEKFTWPILVLPEYNIAFLSNHGAFPAEQPVDAELYSMDLSTEAQTFITKEKANWAFQEMVYTGTDIFYGVMPGNDESYTINKIGLNSLEPKIIFSDVGLYKDFIDREWLSLYKDGGFVLYSIFGKGERIIGKGNKSGLMNVTDGTEIVRDVIGVIDGIGTQ